MKLLDKVRGHAELDCLLGKTGKESEERHVVLARLYLAIKYQEKPVSYFPSNYRLEWWKLFLLLVCCSFKLPTKTGGNLASANSKYIQIKSHHSFPLNSTVYLHFTICLCFVYLDLVVNVYD